MFYLHSLENLYKCIFGSETAQASGEREARSLTTLLPASNRDSGQSILFIGGRFVWRACDANYDIGNEVDGARNVIMRIIRFRDYGKTD